MSDQPLEDLTSLLVFTPTVQSPTEYPTRLPYQIPSDNPMMELISDPPSTPSHSTNGYPTPSRKKTKKEFTHIIYPTQDLSDLSSPLTLDPTSSNFVLPSAIKSTVYPIVLLSPVP